MKKVVVILTIVAFMMACKKEDATSKIDPNTEAIAPADPDAINPEPTLAAPEVKTNQPPADGKYPEMTFDKTEHDFGTIKQGDKVEHTFAFKNTGQAPLLIQSARASCGCTVPEYPKDSIMPGKTGKIKVSFNSSGKKGMVTKTVTISCNTEKSKELLTIKTNIIAPEKGK